METVTFDTKPFDWTTADGLKISAKDWHVQNAKAVIIIIHGLGEHCERYAPMASFFNKNEIGFVGYDRRGHGRSEGKRGHTIHFQAYLDEVAELVKHTEILYPKTPVFLYGHSMGGNIALNFVLKRNSKIAGLITTGAWIELYKNPPSLLIAFAKMINKIYPAFTQSNGLDPNHISTVPDEVEKYKNDPLVHNKITSNTALEMMKAADFLNTFRGELPVPTLIMHGGDDKIISAKGSSEFAKRASGDVTFREWKGLYHEIHNESIRYDVFEFALQWINRILGR
jgi:alpha-beta hydrolase superfamily lysophospholipase